MKTLLGSNLLAPEDGPKTQLTYNSSVMDISCRTSVPQVPCHATSCLPRPPQCSGEQGMTRVPTSPRSPASLAVNEAANPLTYLHGAGRLLLLHHVAAHTLEDFSVGEVGAVQCLHVGV